MDFVSVFYHSFVMLHFYDEVYFNDVIWCFLPNMGLWMTLQAHANPEFI